MTEEGEHPPLGTKLVPHCLLCGSADAALLFQNRDRLHGVPGEFELLVCNSCSLIRLSPRPDESSLAAYYPKDDYYSLQPHIVRDLPTRRAAGSLRDALRALLLHTAICAAVGETSFMRRLARLVPRSLRRRALYGREDYPPTVSPGLVLDIGCGNGAFLYLLKTHGWSVYGVDVSPAAQAVASALDIPVHVGDVESLPDPAESYDVVHMRHVIEHVDDPMSTLRKVRHLTKPGGLLYVETPNIRAWSFRRAKEYWYPLDTPRHLWLFSPKTLSSLLTGSGFEITQLWTTSFPTYEWELTYRVEERLGHQLTQRPAPIPLRARPRAWALGTANAVMNRMSGSRRETICCWARLRD